MQRIKYNINCPKRFIKRTASSQIRRMPTEEDYTLILLTEKDINFADSNIQILLKDIDSRIHWIVKLQWLDRYGTTSDNRWVRWNFRYRMGGVQVRPWSREADKCNHTETTQPKPQHKHTPYGRAHSQRGWKKWKLEEVGVNWKPTRHQLWHNQKGNKSYGSLPMDPSSICRPHN